jgi:RimJ/RimL family protein N-acetyltransferase
MDFLLRKWTESDVDSLIKHADNFEIAKWLTNQFPHPYTKQDGEEFIATVSCETPTKVFAIEIDNEVAGNIGIFPQTDIHEKSAEIGYWLLEKYWGHGVMTDAIKRIVAYGFETFDISRIYARPFSTNIASQRVLQKAGLQLEATLSKAIYKNGKYMDELIYAIQKYEINEK